MKCLSYEEIRDRLDKLEIVKADNYLNMAPPSRVESLGVATNIEASVYAAKLLQEVNNHDPKLLFVLYHRGGTADLEIHTSALYGSSNGFRSVGKSDSDLLTTIDDAIFAKIDLANEFARDIESRGFQPLKWSVLYLSDSAITNWKTTEQDISKLYSELLFMHSKYSYSFSHK